MYPTAPQKVREMSGDEAAGEDSSQKMKGLKGHVDGKKAVKSFEKE